MHALRKAHRIIFSRTERLQDGSSRQTHHIAEDTRQFDPGLFEHLLDPIDQSLSSTSKRVWREVRQEGAK